MSADGFPEIPKGSPGGIRAGAAALRRAARGLSEVDSGLKGATGALQADWHGIAAGTYRTAADSFAAEAVKSGGLIGDAADATEAYAGALEQAQHELRQLKVQYDDARTREATAAGAAIRLGAELLMAPDHAVAGLESDVAQAAGDARAAADDATRILHRAQHVRQHFDDEQRKADAALTGAAGARDGASHGLGATPIGAGDIGGSSTLVPTSSIPKFDDYMHSDWVVGSAEPDDSLLNPVDLLAGGLAGLGRRAVMGAAERLLTGAGEGLGITTRGQIARDATRQAEAELDAILGPTSRRSEAIKAAGTNAEFKAHYEIDAHQARTIRTVLEGASKAGAPLPPGAGDFLSHVAENQTAYRYYVIGRLMHLQYALEARGTRAALHAADRITHVINSLSR